MTDGPDPKRPRLSRDELESMSKDDLIEEWMKRETYVDALEIRAIDGLKDNSELASLRESEEKMRQQQVDAARRESVLVMRLTTKEQEMQEYATQIQELKRAQVPGTAQLRATLLDPSVNLMFERMRRELESTKAKLEETQNDLSAWKFTPDSNTGKRLMAKCRLLYQENEELGKMISAGRVAKLEGDLALQRNFSEEMKKSQAELDEFLSELDEDVEGMQSTIYFLQQQLREAREAASKLQRENSLLRSQAAAEAEAEATPTAASAHANHARVNETAENETGSSPRRRAVKRAHQEEQDGRGNDGDRPTPPKSPVPRYEESLTSQQKSQRSPPPPVAGELRTPTPPLGNIDEVGGHRPPSNTFWTVKDEPMDANEEEELTRSSVATPDERTAVGIESPLSPPLEYLTPPPPPMATSPTPPTDEEVFGRRGASTPPGLGGNVIVARRGASTPPPASPPPPLLDRSKDRWTTLPRHVAEDDWIGHRRRRREDDTSSDSPRTAPTSPLANHRRSTVAGTSAPMSPTSSSPQPPPARTPSPLAPPPAHSSNYSRVAVIAVAPPRNGHHPTPPANRNHPHGHPRARPIDDEDNSDSVSSGSAEDELEIDEDEDSLLSDTLQVAASPHTPSGSPPPIASCSSPSPSPSPLDFSRKKQQHQRSGAGDKEVSPPPPSTTTSTSRDRLRRGALPPRTTSVDGEATDHNYELRGLAKTATVANGLVDCVTARRTPGDDADSTSNA